MTPRTFLSVFLFLPHVVVADRPKCYKSLTADEGTITSPNYPSPYENNTNCVWQMTTRPGRTLELTFTDFQLEEAKYDSVSIYDGSQTPIDFNRPLFGPFGGNQLPDPVQSPSNSLVVAFRSDATEQFRGFEATYSVIKTVAEKIESFTTELDIVKQEIVTLEYAQKEMQRKTNRLEGLSGNLGQDTAVIEQFNETLRQNNQLLQSYNQTIGMYVNGAENVNRSISDVKQQLNESNFKFNRKLSQMYSLIDYHDLELHQLMTAMEQINATFDANDQAIHRYVSTSSERLESYQREVESTLNQTERLNERLNSIISEQDIVNNEMYLVNSRLNQSEALFNSAISAFNETIVALIEIAETKAKSNPSQMTGENVTSIVKRMDQASGQLQDEVNLIRVDLNKNNKQIKQTLHEINEINDTVHQSLAVTKQLELRLDSHESDMNSMYKTLNETLVEQRHDLDAIELDTTNIMLDFDKRINVVNKRMSAVNQTLGVINETVGSELRDVGIKYTSFSANVSALVNEEAKSLSKRVDRLEAISGVEGKSLESLEREAAFALESGNQSLGVLVEMKDAVARLEAESQWLKRCLNWGGLVLLIVSVLMIFNFVLLVSYIKKSGQTSESRKINNSIHLEKIKSEQEVTAQVVAELQARYQSKL